MVCNKKGLQQKINNNNNNKEMTVYKNKKKMAFSKIVINQEIFTKNGFNPRNRSARIVLKPTTRNFYVRKKVVY